MPPRSPWYMCFSAALVVRKPPSRWIASIFFQSAKANWSIGLMICTPALEIRMSRRPNAATTLSVPALTASSLVSAIATLAPCCAYSSAIALPRPLAAPVIRATLPLRLVMRCSFTNSEDRVFLLPAGEGGAKRRMRVRPERDIALRTEPSPPPLSRGERGFPSMRLLGEIGVRGQAAVERVVQLPGLLTGYAGAGDALAVARPQCLQIVADVVEHQVGGVAAANVGEGVAVAVHAHIDRVGVAEQVVDVAQGFLVGADHEDAEPVAFAVPQRVQR